MIRLYGKPGCPGCENVESFLLNRGVDFDYFDVTRDEEALDFVISLGLQTVPVTAYEELVVIGYDPLSLGILVVEAQAQDFDTQPIDTDEIRRRLNED